MKKIALLLIGVLILMSVCGCSINKPKTTDGISLLWYVPGDKQADMSLINEAISKITSESIEVKTQIEFIDSAAYNEKMSLIMAAGNEYDLCFTGYLNKYLDAVRAGGLMDITDLMKLTPNLKNSLPDYVLEGATVDGKIYAIPNYQIIANGAGISVNKALAEKYNFDPSKMKSTLDLEPFLKIVKDNEPNIYPFRNNWGIDSFQEIDLPHGDKGSSLFSIIIKDGKRIAVSGVEYGGAKSKTAILRDWYKKGYIRKDSASVNDDSGDAKAGRYAAQLTAYKPGVEAEDSVYMGGEVISVPISKTSLDHNSIRATMTGIGANSKNSEKAIKLIELVNTNKELYNLICFGIEGKHYEKIGENRLKPVESSGYNPNASWKFGNQFNAYLLSEQKDGIWEESIRLNDNAEKIASYGFDADTTPYQTQLAQCQTIQKQYYTMVNSGAVDPEAFYDEYIKKLYDAGLKDILGEVQKQLDEFYKQ